MEIEHLTSRIYSPADIPLWLRRTMSDWESRFSAEALAYGRKLYKDNAIFELELKGGEAIACARINGESPYTVIDFDDGDSSFSYRGSQDDKFLTASLAVAGFYEIEELLANVLAEQGDIDLSDLQSSPIDDKKDSAPKTQSAPDTSKPPAFKEDSRPPRRLLLVFESKRTGLKFDAYWRDGKSARGRRAFGSKCAPIESLCSAECESLIRLANFARKAGFKYSSDSYLLSDISKISPFMSHTLDKWREYFDIRKDRNVDLLALGERRLKLTSTANAANSGESDFDVVWTPTVGDCEIDSAEFQKLCSGDSSLRILPNYGIVKFSMSDAGFVRKVESAREFGFEPGKIPRYMLLSLSDFGERMEMSGELKSWMESILKKDGASGMTFPDFLRKYQKNGVAWAIRLFSHGCNAIIADEMGLGKTLQSLALINASIRRSADRGEIPPRFLVVCPASVIPVWVSETSKFFPDMVCNVVDSKCDFSKGDILISSYTQLRRNKLSIEKIRFKIAVLDEAQFIKNPDAKTTSACMSINAEHKLALTGTPVENRLLDLWTVFRWLMPGLMGTRKNFEDMVNGDVHGDLVKSLRRQIAPFVLRRMKSEVAEELPEKIYVDLKCPLSDLQKSEYSKLLLEARGEMGNLSQAKSKITILALLTRLRQVSCDAMLLPWVAPQQTSEVGGKLSVLGDKIEELFLGGKKILIFSQFTKFLDLVRSVILPRVGEGNIYQLTGSTRDRAKPVDSFQNAKGGAVMLASLRAAGTGITLSTADYVFIADPWWNPAVEEQAIDRVHRIGRHGEVFVYRLIAQDTVEDRVRALQTRKRKLFDDIFEGLKDVSSGSRFAETIAEILK